MPLAPGHSLHEREIEELREREARYRASLTRQARLSERLRACSDALQEALQREAPSARRLHSSLVEIARLSRPALACARASVWIYDEPSKSLRCTVELVGDTVSDEAANKVVLAQPAYQDYLAPLLTAAAITVQDVAHDPRTRSFEDHLRARNIGALLSVPIRVAGALLGLVSYEHVGEPRAFHAEEIEFGASVGSLMALALETERRLRAEHAQRQSEARYRQLVESLPLVVYAFDLTTGTLSYVSPNARELGGWSAEQWLQAGAAAWIERIHPDDRPSVFMRYDLDSLNGGFPTELTYRISLPDGRLRVIRDTCSVVRDFARPVSLQGALLDVTDEIEAKNGYRALELRHRSILDHGDVHAIIVDRDARVLFANEYLCRVAGYTREELLGRDWFELTAPPSERERLRAEYLAGLARGGFEARIQAPLHTSTGQVRQVLWTTTLFRGLDGSIQGTSALGVDITQRLELEAELQQQTKVESLGRLAARVAHDFNNLLTAMLQESERLRSFVELLPQAAREPSHNAYRALRTALDQASDLTHSLLVYGRGGDMQREDVDLDELIEETQPLAASIAGPELSVEISAHSEGARVQIERGQLRHLLQNLVGNAADATRGFGSSIQIRAHREFVDADVARRHGRAHAGEFAVLTVSDDGRGMDQRTLSRIFEPFFTTKTADQGTGLGLAMCRSVVERVGGFITVESAPERGSTFRLYLPITPDLAPAHVPAPAAASAPPALQLTSAAAPASVLIVDDMASVRKPLAQCLRDANYSVLEAEDVASASQELAAKPISVLVVDANLPDGSGVVLARSARKVRPELKVVLVSGAPEPDRGFDAMLQKPFGLDQFMEVITALLPAPAPAS